MEDEEHAPWHEDPDATIRSGDPQLCAEKIRHLRKALKTERWLHANVVRGYETQLAELRARGLSAQNANTTTTIRRQQERIDQLEGAYRNLQGGMEEDLAKARREASALRERIDQLEAKNRALQAGMTVIVDGKDARERAHERRDKERVEAYSLLQDRYERYRVDAESKMGRLHAECAALGLDIARLTEERDLVRKGRDEAVARLAEALDKVAESPAGRNAETANVYEEAHSVSYTAQCEPENTPYNQFADLQAGDIVHYVSQFGNQLPAIVMCVQDDQTGLVNLKVSSTGEGWTYERCVRHSAHHEPRTWHHSR